MQLPAGDKGISHAGGPFAPDRQQGDCMHKHHAGGMLDRFAGLKTVTVHVQVAVRSTWDLLPMQGAGRAMESVHRPGHALCTFWNASGGVTTPGTAWAGDAAGATLPLLLLCAGAAVTSAAVAVTRTARSAEAKPATLAATPWSNAACCYP